VQFNQFCECTPSILEGNGRKDGSIVPASCIRNLVEKVKQNFPYDDCVADTFREQSHT